MADHHPQDAPLGLYIHIPFCAKKCPYCDFNTYARLEPLYEAYTQALCRELEQWGRRLAGRPVHTVFIGGGTPTILSTEQLTAVLNTVWKQFSVAAGAEITSEANPGTVDQERFALLHDLGVNRLSMGVQSFRAEELAFLGRIHSADEVLRAYDAARCAGFGNINLDFMFGLPPQSINSWEATLDKALALAPQHLSLYSLIVEPETPLFHWVETGQVAPPDEDLAAEMYELGMERLQDAGYTQYEVSNWAREPALACQHNLIYWRNQEWIGVGAGAHSHLRVASGLISRSNPDAVARRWSNRRAVQGYMNRITAGESCAEFQEELPDTVSMGETMMLGLRLIHEGVSFARFAQMHGQEMTDVFGAELDRLQAANLLVVDNERVRLTETGLLIGNQVFSEFI